MCSSDLTGLGSGYITTPTITITDANTTPGTGATATINGETDKAGGNITAKYITKKVSLDSGFESGDLNVYMTAYRPVNSDIHVYYKILNKSDTQKFDDGNWQIMTKVRSSDSLYSSTRGDLYEYVYAPGTEGFDGEPAQGEGRCDFQQALVSSARLPAGLWSGIRSAKTRIEGMRASPVATVPG